MKKITSKSENFSLDNLSIKEIMAKYPDKVMGVYAEGKNVILVLDTCRIKFVNVKIKGV